MAGPARDPLREWQDIVPMVESRVRGRSDRELDGGRNHNGMTLRETVHHVVEANVVAAGIVVAALGSPGSTFDWSWMQPFGAWLQRLRYDRKPIAPALDLLAALNAWVVAQVEPLPDGLQRTVQLRDEPGGALRTATVGEVLLAEADHARHEFGGEE